jgi:1-acyl-sn-glycerol-3-phosphate acyltransferase
MSVLEVPGVIKRRLAGDYVVDQWGADHDWLDSVAFMTRLAVRPEIEGAERIPDGPAVLVANRRFGIGEALALCVAVRSTTGRMLRPIGVPDIAPIGPLLRRFGAVQDSTAEIRSLLHHSELVGIALSGQLRVQRAGSVRPDVLLPAIDFGAPVLPVAILGGELSGSWRIVVGERIEPPATPRRRSLAAAELADRARAGVQVLLDDAFPARWSLG